MRVEVAVVGGGFAGLLTASELVGAGIDDVVVLAEGQPPGGVARTIERAGYSVEPGAGTLVLPHPHLSPALDRVGAEVSPAIGGGARYLFDRGRLARLPSSPKALLAPIMPPLAKLRAVAEPLIRSAGPPEETLEAFMARRFGGAAGRSLAWLAASGVFAGDPARLSASAAFPILTGLEREAGSIVKGAVARRRSRPEGAPRPTAHIPAGGMAGLADHMSGWLGDRYRSESPITHLRPTARGWRVSDDIEANHVVLACGVDAAAAIIGGDAGALLLNVERAPVVVVGLGGRWSPETVPAGFGALVTRRSELVSLGVLFESSYAPDRAPAGHSLVKVIAGGATRPYVAQWDHDRIVEVVGGEVSAVLGADIDASFVEVVRHRIGIPQYLPGHAAWLRDVEGHLPAGIHLAGWNYRGVGITHLATDAARITRTIMGRT